MQIEKDIKKQIAMLQKEAARRSFYRKSIFILKPKGLISSIGLNTKE